LIIELIFKPKRVTAKILPCRTPTKFFTLLNQQLGKHEVSRDLT